MKNLYEFEENTLILPYHEANTLNNKGRITILFKVEKIEVNNIFNPQEILKSEPEYFKSSRSTEVIFPCISWEKEILFNGAIKKTDKDKEYILNGAQFWNYLGDGTHCSKVFSSPFGLIKGQKIQAENKFNISKMDCLITDMNIIRSSELQNDWFWYLVVQKIM